MKLKSIIAATAVLSIACVGAANAQTGTNVQKPIAIKIGASFPQSSSAKDLGNSWFAVGGDYTVSKSQANTAVQNLVYVDYTSKSKNGADARYTGVGIGTRSTAPVQSATGYTLFYGAGMGAYFQNAKVAGVSKNATSYGAKASIGLDFSQGFFLEGGYTWISNKVNSVNLSGFNLYAGFKF